MHIWDCSLSRNMEVYHNICLHKGFLLTFSCRNSFMIDRLFQRMNMHRINNKMVTFNGNSLQAIPHHTMIAICWSLERLPMYIFKLRGCVWVHTIDRWPIIVVINTIIMNCSLPVIVNAWSVHWIFNSQIQLMNILIFRFKYNLFHSFSFFFSLSNFSCFSFFYHYM